MDFTKKNFGPIRRIITSQKYITQNWAKYSKLIIDKKLFKKDIKSLQDPKISDIITTKTMNVEGNEISCIQYKTTYELDFGLLGQTITKAVIDPEVEFTLSDSKYCSICSKHDPSNCRISKYQITENNNRYASNKGIHQTNIQHLKINQSEFEIKSYVNYQVFNTSIEIYNENSKYKKEKWYAEFRRMMIDYYEEELNQELNDEKKENICAFNTTHFAILDENKYQELNTKLWKHKRKYDL